MTETKSSYNHQRFLENQAAIRKMAGTSKETIQKVENFFKTPVISTHQPLNPPQVSHDERVEQIIADYQKEGLTREEALRKFQGL